MSGDVHASLSSAGAWWEADGVVLRFVCDLVAAELSAMRPSGASLPSLPWNPALELGADLGADSLEILGVASALAEAVHLHESGIEDYLLARPTLGDWVGIVKAGLRQFSGALTFRTSGSTGLPKPCTHQLAHLWQEALELAWLFPRRARVFSAVPSHHIYGFIFTVLLPRALRLSASEFTDLRGSTPARLAHELRAGDLVVGHPEFWRALTRTVPSIADGVIGVTSTAPCPDQVSHAANAIGLNKLIQIYGSSETAGVGWREQAQESYRLFSYWRPAAGERHALLRAGADGEMITFPCQDVLQWVDADRFYPLSRIDEVVQVGGINVAPSKVRDVLLRHPDVVQAAVRLMRPDEGQRLKAFIVPRDANVSHAELHVRLDAWVRSHLAAAERPKAFSFSNSLPTGINGKDADWKITRLISNGD